MARENRCKKYFFKTADFNSPCDSTPIFEHHGQIGEQGFYTPKFWKFHVDFKNRC